MGLNDSWNKFRKSAVSNGFAIRMDLDENMIPLNACIGPFCIGRKRDNEEVAEEKKVKAKPKVKARDWENKPIADWSSHALWAYFAHRYLKDTGFPYGAWNNKEHIMLSKLVKEYGPEASKKAVDYLVDNYRTFSWLNGSRPNIPILYGCRRSLIQDAVHGKVSQEITEQVRKQGDVNKW